MRKPRNSRTRTYTKKKMDLIVNVALLDMQFPFILALLGRENIAETMGGLIVTEIVGVFLVYCLKSYFETKESEKTRIAEMKLDNMHESEDSESEDLL